MVSQIQKTIAVVAIKMDKTSSIVIITNMRHQRCSCLVCVAAGNGNVLLGDLFLGFERGNFFVFLELGLNVQLELHNIVEHSFELRCKCLAHLCRFLLELLVPGIVRFLVTRKQA